jgi:hypothetical protein
VCLPESLREQLLAHLRAVRANRRTRKRIRRSGSSEPRSRWIDGPACWRWSPLHCLPGSGCGRSGTTARPVARRASTCAACDRRSRSRRRRSTRVCRAVAAGCRRPTPRALPRNARVRSVLPRNALPPKPQRPAPRAPTRWRRRARRALFRPALSRRMSPQAFTCRRAHSRTCQRRAERARRQLGHRQCPVQRAEGALSRPRAHRARRDQSQPARRQHGRPPQPLLRRRERCAVRPLPPHVVPEQSRLPKPASAARASRTNLLRSAEPRRFRPM